MPDSTTPTILERMKHHTQQALVREGISSGIGKALGGSGKFSVESVLRGSVAQSIGEALAHQIGSSYGAGHINPFEHKLLHAVAGGITGALMSDDPARGALAGAFGAFMAETFADMFAPEKPALESGLLEEDFIRLYEERLKSYSARVGSVAHWSKLVAATSALIAGQDVSIAHSTGDIAVENNFAYLAYLGLVGVGIAWSAYDISQAYQEDGAKGALQQIGIEIVYVAVAGRALKLAPKAVKYAGKLYPTVKDAMTAALKNKRGLATVLGEEKVSKIIVEGSELLGQKTTSSKSLTQFSKTTKASVASNSARYELFKRDLRREMAKPHVDNKKLGDFINNFYRPNAKVGSGSTAAALRHERFTGDLVGGRSHAQKVEDGIKFLDRWLKKNPTAFPGDRAAAENMLKDLVDATKAGK